MRERDSFIKLGSPYSAFIRHVMNGGFHVTVSPTAFKRVQLTPSSTTLLASIAGKPDAVEDLQLRSPVPPFSGPSTASERPWRSSASGA